MTDPTPTIAAQIEAVLQNLVSPESTEEFDAVANAKADIVTALRQAEGDKPNIKGPLRFVDEGHPLGLVCYDRDGRTVSLHPAIMGAVFNAIAPVPDALRQAEVAPGVVEDRVAEMREFREQARIDATAEAQSEAAEIYVCEVAKVRALSAALAPFVTLVNDFEGNDGTWTELEDDYELLGRVRRKRDERGYPPKLTIGHFRQARKALARQHGAREDAPTQVMIEAGVAAFGQGDGWRTALRLAEPIVEADYEAAKEACEADWEGMSFTALEAIRTALSANPRAPDERDDEVAARCTAIADQVVPKYRGGRRAYSCGGIVAHQWQAAWDAACIAQGADPTTYLSPPLTQP